jgi:regulator of cell morphogenesis and NO signaling
VTAVTDQLPPARHNGGMATLTQERSIGEIAAEMPGSVRVFEKYNIDYCCGGKVSLAEACARRGLAPEQLIEELGSAVVPGGTESAVWQSASLDTLIDHILTRHHGYLKTELPRLSRMMRKVMDAHGANHGDSLVPLGATFEALKQELESHLMKEEMVLFPIIRKLEGAGQSGAAPALSHCGSIGNPIRVMEHEHESAGRALEQMRALTCDYSVPADACNTYRGLFYGLQQLETDLHQHIHLENNILFPRAATLEARL